MLVLVFLLFRSYASLMKAEKMTSNLVSASPLTGFLLSFLAFSVWFSLGRSVC